MQFEGETSAGQPTLAELGEFAVIDSLVTGRSQLGSVLIGPGDDAAVVSASDGRVLVSTDMLVHGRHFRFDWSSPYEVGRKAVAQNAADIEAMGGRVSAFVVALGAPASTPHAQVVALTDGMWAEAARCGAGIVGGDLVASDQWVISVTVLGGLDNRRPVLRSAARPGSVIAVAGSLGRSAAGLAVLRAGLPGFAELCAAHRVPAPPYGQGPAAAAAGATAMTDVSDGLIADLRHIAVASGVDIDLHRSALGEDHAAVAAAASELGVDGWDWVLGGGEDHALVACFPDGVPEGWRGLGEVVERAVAPEVRVDGAPWTGAVGWDSFG